MTIMSDVSLLIAQRAGDLEKAMEIFRGESRSFVKGVLAGIRRTRSEAWTMPRVRIDIPRDIEVEARAATNLTSQVVEARAALRFKKGTVFQHVADAAFGVRFDGTLDQFAWCVELRPATRYPRLDDLVWQHWRTQEAGRNMPGALHQERANAVTFVSRGLTSEVSAEIAFNDAKAVLDFLLAAEVPLGSAVGLDATPGEEQPTG